MIGHSLGRMKARYCAIFGKGAVLSFALLAGRATRAVGGYRVDIFNLIQNTGHTTQVKYILTKSILKIQVMLAMLTMPTMLSMLTQC